MPFIICLLVCYILPKFFFYTLSLSDVSFRLTFSLFSLKFFRRSVCLVHPTLTHLKAEKKGSGRSHTESAGNPFCSSSRSPDTSRPHSLHSKKSNSASFRVEKKRNKVNLQVSAIVSCRPAAPSQQHLEKYDLISKYLPVFLRFTIRGAKKRSSKYE